MINEWEDSDVSPSPITPKLLDAVRHVESRGNPKAVSPAGARGPYQFMPGTAKQYGLADPHDEPSARQAAERYLTDLTKKFGGDTDKALLAYNWGPGNVERHLKTGGPMPVEAQQYVGKVRAAEGRPRAPVSEWSDDDIAPAPRLADRAKQVAAPSLKDTMAEQTNQDIGTALSTGIANSASRTVRALGTTLLPKSAEEWVEKKGWMPTARDIALLSHGTQSSPTATGASIAGDIATEILPASRAMKGAATFKQALPRAAALGGTIGGMRAEGDLEDIATGAGLGALGGVAGEGAGRLLARAVTPTVAATDEAKRLMARGIFPTLGDAADKGTVTGKVLKFLEGQAETMPVAGMTQRAAKEGVQRQLLQEAAGMAVPPGRTLPQGTRNQMLDELQRMNSQEFSKALEGTSVKATHRLKRIVDSSIDTMKVKHGVSDDVADDIKQEMNKKFWAGVRGGEASGQNVFNATEDMFKGLSAAQGSTAAKQLVNEVALGFKNHLNSVAQKQGFDLEGVRKSAAVAHALRAAGGSEEGITGAQLMHGVRSNNRATNSVDATYDLQKLAEDASNSVTRSRGAFGSHNPLQLVRNVVGNTVGAAPILAYGGVNNSKWLKERLLRDPKYRATIIKALQAPSTLAGTHTMIDKEQDNAP